MGDAEEPDGNLIDSKQVCVSDGTYENEQQFEQDDCDIFNGQCYTANDEEMCRSPKKKQFVMGSLDVIECEPTAEQESQGDTTNDMAKDTGNIAIGNKRVCRFYKRGRCKYQ